MSGKRWIDKERISHIFPAILKGKVLQMGLWDKNKCKHFRSLQRRAFWIFKGKVGIWRKVEKSRPSNTNIVTLSLYNNQFHLFVCFAKFYSTGIIWAGLFCQFTYSWERSQVCWSSGTPQVLLLCGLILDHQKISTFIDLFFIWDTNNWDKKRKSLVSLAYVVPKACVRVPKAFFLLQVTQ